MSKDLKSSRVNYSNLKTDGSQLDNYLKMLSFVKKETLSCTSHDDHTCDFFIAGANLAAYGCRCLGKISGGAISNGLFGRLF